MTIWEYVRCRLRGECPAPWNADDDDDVQFLIRKRDEAEAATARLRQLRTGNIVEDAVTGRLGRRPPRSA